MFEEDLLIVDIEGSVATSADRPAWPEEPEEVYRALTLGLGDYVRKNGFRDVVVGLSGGIDSSLVATLAADALGPEAVRVLAMPSPLVVARERRGRCRLRRPVEGPPRHDPDLLGVRRISLGARRRVRRARRGCNRGEPPGADPRQLSDGALEQVRLARAGHREQERVRRGLRDVVRRHGRRVRSHKDVPKTLVYELAAWRNAQSTPAPIPERVMMKPPSAELRPDQLDTDSLPPYDRLDPIVEAYVEDDLGVDEIEALGHDRGMVERVVRMIDRAEYKRRQAAPGVKITPKAFGRNRRMPITNRFASD